MIEEQKLSIARTSLVRLLHRKKGRAAERAYLAEGERLLDELAADPSGVRFLFGTADRMAWIRSRFPGVASFVVDDNKAGALFATEHAQGLGAVVQMPEPGSFGRMAAAGRPLLYLDGLADPGNVGTILRSAEWFGIGGVLFGEGTADPYNPKVVRATMGAIFRLPIAGDITPRDLMESGLPLLALDGGGDELLGTAELPPAGIYIVGNEAHGVSPQLLAHARSIAIAGSGRGESLNAAIAAAVLMYEVGKRR